MIPTEYEGAIRLSIAALIGLGIGLEREWSHQIAKDTARFGGIRTFFLLGIIGGVTGLLLALGHEIAGGMSLLVGMLFCVVAYATSVTRVGLTADGTTEVAGLVVIGLGTLAGVGWLALAAGCGSLAVLALREKEKLHWFVNRVDESELRAAAQFAVFALVILPLLPEELSVGSSVHPRLLWTTVLLFSALNFFGFVVRKLVGTEVGFTLSGLLGGLLSSTAVAFDFSRLSRKEEGFRRALAYGTIGASTVLMPRIIVVTAVLNVPVSLQLCRILALPFACGCALVVWGWRSGRVPSGVVAAKAQPENPLRFRVAVQMAVIFQIATYALTTVHRVWGSAGLLSTAALMGAADMDAVTLTITRLGGGLLPAQAAQAIVVGMIANTVLKSGIAAVLGRGDFRRITLTGFTIILVACGVAIAIFA
ncbi:MAG: DUF4010 domain-containing protein [Gemmatimonadaceae bacterium]